MGLLIRLFFRTLPGLIWSWFVVDRIRINPTAGRLLQLKAGDAMVLRNELYVVRLRQWESLHGETQVCYLLQDSMQQSRTLIVTGNGCDGIVVGHMSLQNDSITVTDDEVVILKAESSAVVEGLCIRGGGSR